MKNMFGFFFVVSVYVKIIFFIFYLEVILGESFHCEYI